MRKEILNAKDISTCQICGSKLAAEKPDQVYQNLWVFLGLYSVKIEIAKQGMVTELCADCLKQIVRDAMGCADPFFGLVLPGDSAATEAKKRSQRRSCPAYLLA